MNVSFIVVCFIVLHWQNVKSMDTVLDFVKSKNQDMENIILKLATQVDDLDTKFTNDINELGRIINHNAATVIQFVNGDVLDIINGCTDDLSMLKNQLYNELMHLQQYRRNFEAFLQQHNDRLAKLELLYTSLRFDVNLVNVESIKQQTDKKLNDHINIITQQNKLLVYKIDALENDKKTLIVCLSGMGFVLFLLTTIIGWQQYQIYNLTQNKY